MDINTKITYRGWIHLVIESNGWTESSFPKFKKLCITQLKGMASTWLKNGKQTYHKTYMNHLKRLKNL